MRHENFKLQLAESIGANEMPNQNEKLNTSKVYTTKEASKKLGVSLRTVQLWAGNGTLVAWRTAGGHRRVSAASIEEYLSTRGAPEPQPAKQKIEVLIAEDDPILSKLYKLTISGWGIPVKIDLVSDGFDALMHLGKNIPDIFISDLNMPGIDGITLMNKIQTDPKYNDMEIIVVTGLDSAEIHKRGGLPANISVFLKPAPFALIQAKIQEIANKKMVGKSSKYLRKDEAIN